jgi:hypothetical protein
MYRFDVHPGTRLALAVPGRHTRRPTAAELAWHAPGAVAGRRRPVALPAPAAVAEPRPRPGATPPPAAAALVDGNSERQEARRGQVGGWRVAAGVRRLVRTVAASRLLL